MNARTSLLICLVSGLALAACGDDGNANGEPGNQAPGKDAANSDATVPDAGAGDGGDTPIGFDTPPADCDPLDPAICALPWPSNLYLADDPTTATGRTIAFGATTLPKNRNGVHIGAETYRRLDGYGLGTPIMAIFPGVDTSKMPGEESIEVSVGETTDSLLLKVTDEGLEQVPHWVEADAYAEEDSGRILYMRPAVILEEKTRYIVAYRNLRALDGAEIAPSQAFLALRDDTPTDDPAVEARRDRFATIFDELETAGFSREELTLAWDFETGSEASLHGPVDAATELALGQIEGVGATFIFDEIEAFSKDGGGQLEQSDVTAYQITGKMVTPTVLRPNGPTNELNLDEGALSLNGASEAPVHIVVPHRAAAGETVGVIVYGHGMLGSSQEVFAGHLRRLAEELGYLIIGVDFRGMSAADTPGVLAAMSDMTRFTHLADGAVQGIAQTHVLAQSATTSLQSALKISVDEQITLSDDVQWFGASQGGIYGASILATSPVFERGILAVPGNNYSTLLHRSVNFVPFFDQLASSYGSQADVAVVIAAAQLLWDFTDPVSYWRRLAQDEGPNGLRDSLLLVSKGDKQVAVVTNEILARTLPEVPLMEPYDVDRQPWGAATATYPHQGSGQILFDFGNPWPIGRGNQPPDDELPDPHSRIAEVDAVSQLLASFLTDSTIIDVCGGDGCRPD